MPDAVTLSQLESYFWKASSGEREVKQELRSALRKYKLRTDQDLFDKAYGYIREYY